jgi:hypothetical protein
MAEKDCGKVVRTRTNERPGTTRSSHAPRIAPALDGDIISVSHGDILKYVSIT